MPVSSLLMGSLMGGGGAGGMGGGIANIAGGLVSGVAGLFQKRKAKKMLDGLQRPQYSIPQEILKSQKMAEMAANEGLPSAQYNNAMKNIQRQQANAISAATDRRGGLMAVSKIQQASNDAVGNLDAQDAQARMQNQKTLYGVSGQTAQYRDKAFQINQMQPYQQKRDYAMSVMGAGNQNLMSGVDKALGGVGMLIGNGGIGKRKPNASASASVSAPTYYNGYDGGSSYGDFENGY